MSVVTAWKEYEGRREGLEEGQKEEALLGLLQMKIDGGQFKETVQESQQVKETAIQELGALLVQQKGGPEKVRDLVMKEKWVLADLSKTKMAKVTRNLLDMVGRQAGSEHVQLELCEYLVGWCEEEKRNYLRQRVQIKLATLLGQLGQYQRGLALTEALTKEVRKSDDKHLLVEVQLTESIIHFRLRNMAKAKASLTASRACANQIYCPLHLQAEIDKMNGVLLAEDKDYKTAYSYFYESFEALNSLPECAPKALLGLKYMMLAKVMTNQTEDVLSLYSGKYGLKYQNVELEAMKAVAEAARKKSLVQFQGVLDTFRPQIEEDPVVSQHVQSLYDQLLQSNLQQVIEPYSKVQLSFVAQQVNLPLEFVLEKLSEMILDKKVTGTLDQGNGCLIIFDELPCDDLYSNSLKQMSALDSVVDQLFLKAKLLKQA